MYIHVHECKYMYGHGTDMSVQIHNHTSHSITQFTCNCMYVSLFVAFWLTPTTINAMQDCAPLTHRKQHIRSLLEQHHCLSSDTKDHILVVLKWPNVWVFTQ